MCIARTWAPEPPGRQVAQLACQLGATSTRAVPAQGLAGTCGCMQAVQGLTHLELECCLRFDEDEDVVEWTSDDLDHALHRLAKVAGW